MRNIAVVAFLGIVGSTLSPLAGCGASSEDLSDLTASSRQTLGQDAGTTSGDGASSDDETSETNGAGAVSAATPLPPDPIVCESAECCRETTQAIVELTDGNDYYPNASGGVCVLGKLGNDILDVSGPDTTIIASGGDDLVRRSVYGIVYGGSGADRIEAAAGGHVYGNDGDDSIVVSGGEGSFVLPGPGRDTVQLSAGENTVAILDVCELMAGESLTGDGDDTLIAPIAKAELEARGVTVSGFSEIRVEAHSCASECVEGRSCSDHGQCESLDGGGIRCICEPPYEGEHCETEGECTAERPCGPGAPCDATSDCQSGLDCVAAGELFGKTAGITVCLDPICVISPQIDCGSKDSRCGPVCTPKPRCSSEVPCPEGMRCVDYGHLHGAPGRSVCEPLDCETARKNGQDCGKVTDRCGLCACVPDCSSATCENPDNGCGGRCVGVCNDGDACAENADCKGGSSCGGGVCKPTYCLDPRIKPPLCGPGTQCGPCPASEINACAGRECGTHPVTGEQCGSPCPSGLFCNAAGHCAQSDGTPPVRVPDEPTGDRVVLPDLSPRAAELGAIAGMFSVTERGSSSYEIPIEAPPGRSIEPRLSLRYTSTTSNGALGMGWSIDGLSTISRCPRAYPFDGNAEPINGELDAYCLDGQRLEDVRSEPEFVYHTAIESFTEVFAVGYNDGEPESFKALTKDGRILYYGTTPDSKAGMRGGKTRAWALSRIEDRRGNFLRINYLNEGAIEASTGKPLTRELLPLAITYTGHGARDGDREIQFIYGADRKDTLFGYQVGGDLMYRTKRLESIDVRAQNKSVRTYQIGYEATFAPHVSRISSITECAGGEGAPCKAPTAFSYYDESGFGEAKEMGFVNEFGGGPRVQYEIPFGSVRGAKAGYDVLDLLNQTVNVNVSQPVPAGVDIAVAMVPTYGWIASTAIQMLNLFGRDTDVDRDWYRRTVAVGTGFRAGRQLCNGSDHAPDSHLIALPDGSQTFYDTCQQTTIYSPPDEIFRHWTLTYKAREWFIDANGDGVQDKLLCSLDGNKLGYKLATPHADAKPSAPTGATFEQMDGELDAFGELCDFKCTKISSNAGIKDYCNEELFDRPFTIVFDIDGDGTTNLISYDAKTKAWASLHFEQTGSGVRPHWRTDLFEDFAFDPNPFYVTAADVNGDGYRDIVALPSVVQAPNESPRVYVNTSRGFRGVSLRPDNDSGEAPEYPLFVVDYDHDGVEELLQPGSESPRIPNECGEPKWNDQIKYLKCVAAHQARLEKPATWYLRRIDLRPGAGTITTDNLPFTDFPGVIGDFNGDGNIDLFTKRPKGPNYLRLGTGKRMHLLKSVTDGFGRHIEVKYDEENALPAPIKPSPDPREIYCRWPITCSKRKDQVRVSLQIEGHYIDAARQQLHVDKQVAYTYDGHRAAVGFGSLGFQTRLIEERDGSGMPLKKTRIDYWDPDEWTPTSSVIGYRYPLVGLPRTIEETMASAKGPLNTSERYEVRLTEFVWEEKKSTWKKPFPFLKRKTVRTTWGSESPDIHRGITEQIEEYEGDELGNQTKVTLTAHDFERFLGDVKPGSTTRLEVKRTYINNVSSWLIGLPDTETVTSDARCTGAIECSEKRRVRFTKYEHDTKYGDLISSEREPSDLKLHQKTTLVRDAWGNIKSIAAASGGSVRTTSIDYDQRGLFPTTLTNTYGRATQVRFDDRFGRLTVRADPNGIDETWTYDDFGILRLQRGPDGEVRNDVEGITPYSVNGIPIPAVMRVNTQKIGGIRVRTDVNALGQIVRRTSQGLNGQDVDEEFEYDARNRLKRQHRPHLPGDVSQSAIDYEYDELDRLIGQTNADGGTIRYEYGVLFDLESAHPEWQVKNGTAVVRVIDPRNNATVAINDRSGLPVALIDALGKVTTYSYGAFDQLESIRDPADRKIHYAHDAWGRVVRIDDAARGGPQFADYNGFDELVFACDGGGETKQACESAGRVMRATYDSLGRQISLKTPEGEATWRFGDESAGPNEIDRLIESVGPTGQRIAYSYEPREQGKNRGYLRQITRKLISPGSVSTNPRDFITTYHFDNLSRLKRVDYPASAGEEFSVEYGFDSVGNVVRASDPANSSTPYWKWLEADQGFRVKKEQLGNGATTERIYEALTGNVSDIITRQNGDTLQHLSYSYDLAGNLQNRADRKALRTEFYKYDELNRPTDRYVTTFPTTAYVYDPLRGRLEFREGIGEYTYDSEGRDWVTTAGDNTFSHDRVGNVQFRSGPDVPYGMQEIDYTASDLPSMIMLGGGPRALRMDFSYDAAGTRVAKKLEERTTFYAGDAYQTTIKGGTGADHRYAVFAGGRIVAQVTRTESSGSITSAATSYLHDDVLGSIHTISGASAQEREYEPFGLPRTSSTGDAVPFGFTGHQHDEEIGLINMRGRMYDPVAGQFLSPDPIMATPFSQGLNRYAYVDNSPLNYIDPSGFTSEEVSAYWNVGTGFGAVLGAGLVGTYAGNAFSGGATVAASSASAGSAAALGPALGPVGALTGAVIGTIFNPTGTSSSTTTVAVSRSANAPSLGAPPRGRATPNDWAPVQERMPVRAFRSPNDGGGGGGGSPDSMGGARGTNGGPPTPGGENLVCPQGAGGNCRLNFAAAFQLSRLFSRFGYDVSAVTVEFGIMFNTQAYTVGDHVTLNKDVWDKMSSKEQRALLAHEVAHSVQYKKLGFRRFMMRYGPEYAFNPDNLNGSVVKETVDKVNIVDSRYTLDQIAESFFDHVMRGP